MLHKVVAVSCGKFGILGSSIEHDYTCMVEYSFELKVGNSVRFILCAL